MSTVCLWKDVTYLLISPVTAIMVIKRLIHPNTVPEDVCKMDNTFISCLTQYMSCTSSLNRIFIILYTVELT